MRFALTKTAFLIVTLVLHSNIANEYVAYKGDSFQIEWYYSAKGDSQAREYYLELDRDDRKQVLKLCKMMGEIVKISDIKKFRNEGDKVYAFKRQPHRFLSFFVQGKKIIVTNSFWKKQKKLPENEKDKASKCMESNLQRVKEGTYHYK